MKVVHIVSKDTLGGAEDFTILLANYFKAPVIVAKKYSVDDNIHLLYEGKYDKAKNKLFTFFDKVLGKLGYHQSFKKAFFLHDTCNNTFNRLNKMDVFRNADIIHLHNIHGGFFDIKAIKQIAKTKKIVWTLHDMWLVTGGEAYTIGNENYKVGNPNTPYTDLYPLYKPYLIDLRGYYMRLKKRVYRSVASQLFIVPVCNWLEDVVKSAHIYNADLNITTIKNGIDLSVFNNTKKRNWTKPRLLVHKSGNPFKGAEALPIILNDINIPVDVYVISGPIKIDNPNVNQIVLDYIKSPEQLAGVFNEVDVMIHSSKAESYSLMILQAMACGVCVFATDVGGTPELLTDGRGVLFNRDDLNNLAMVLSNKLKNIETTRAIGEKASDWVIKNGSFEKMAEAYEQLYKRALNESKWLYHLTNHIIQEMSLNI